LSVLVYHRGHAPPRLDRARPHPLPATAAAQEQRHASRHWHFRRQGRATIEPANKDDKTIARFSLDMQFHGALEGTSRGEMLSTGSPYRKLDLGKKR
jgi:hypothetical protein